MGRVTRRAFATAALATLATGSGASAVPGPRTGASPGPAPRDGASGVPGPRRATSEMRGMWLATVANRDWPSGPGLTAAQQRAELIAHLDGAVRNRLNTVVFQVRPTADALWPSPHEPWSEYLTGTQGRAPGWDPLGTAVTEAHARGLQLHAWFNPYRIALHADPKRLVASHPARRHPDWVVTYGGKLYYNPGLPEVRAFVQDAMLDAVRKYPVDAVHFDDYFYPYPVAGQTFDDDAAYDRHGAAFPNRAAWRRDNIDRLVREMAARIKQTRPAARFGVSPFGVWRNAGTDPLGSQTRAGVQTYDDLHADTRRWVRENWIDYICPQLYWNIGFPAADYAVLLPWWAEVARGTRTTLYLGEALYKAGDPAQPAAWQDPAELSRHLARARKYPEARGHVFFSAEDVAVDRIGSMARVVADHYGQPAKPPR
ncbi:family 10 glycosylhydrolase [Streptomyces luteolifulvus]|uniref:Family 10 glycosylhydrolase n=1 Tax=Streptomyces luteolifulvus TaxID=2615112 RepID=A0A6H9V5P6_9ACTN|nr:family 10 glycosylhydrolase [Streptomyces luteolifulvus]KAB1150646.1 family 10 glycosylhydrolase [Streptomyces luteolifulvus]